jgi:hypothetical protein
MRQRALRDVELHQLERVDELDGWPSLHVVDADRIPAVIEMGYPTLVGPERFQAHRANRDADAKRRFGFGRQRRTKVPVVDSKVSRGKTYAGHRSRRESGKRSKEKVIPMLSRLGVAVVV